jgi:hypothetical protein
MRHNYSNTKTDNVIIRNVTQKDNPKVINLQKESFADMTEYGMIWPTVPDLLHNPSSALLMNLSL